MQIIKTEVVDLSSTEHKALVVVQQILAGVITEANNPSLKKLAKDGTEILNRFLDFTRLEDD